MIAYFFWSLRIETSCPISGHRALHASQARGALKGDANTAVKLDGKRSYIEIPAHKDFSQPASGKGLTVEVWLRPDVLTFEGETDDPYIFWLALAEPTQHEWALRFYRNKSKERSNRISAYIFNPDGGLGAGAYFQDKLTVGEWMHIVACFDPGDACTKGVGVQIYKNGAWDHHRPGCFTTTRNGRSTPCRERRRYVWARGI